MTTPSFSLDHIMALSGNDKAFMVDVLEMFLQKAKEDLEACAALAAEDKWNDVKFIAHRLRSSAGSVGARTVAEHCADLEKILSETDVKKTIPNDYLSRFQRESEAELLQIAQAVRDLKNGD